MQIVGEGSNGRRDNLGVYADVIRALSSRHVWERGELRLTRLQARVYVPGNRLKRHLVGMAECGLIELVPMPRVTEKGHEFLCAYARLCAALDPKAEG